MFKRLQTTVFAALALGLLLTFSGCDEELARGTGSAGFACFFDEECAEGYACRDVPSVDWAVCTGPAPAGGICGPSAACAYIRNDRGLPLVCTDNICVFPGETSPAP